MNKDPENSPNLRDNSGQNPKSQTNKRFDEKYIVSRTGKIILSTLQDALILFKMKT